MFAIVEACGRQYQLEAGRFIDVDLSELNPGEVLVFDKVLMLVDGVQSTVGAPYVQGAKVSAKILAHRKGQKIIVYHQKPKKGTRKKQGHRQHFTRILIDSIELNDKVLAKADEKAHKPAKEEADSSAKTAAPKAKKAAEPKKAAPAKEKAPAKKEKAAPAGKTSEKKSK